jgi:hypothetical protein
MPREPREPRKLLRNNQQRKVAAARRRTCVADVLSAFVRQFEDLRRERGQALLERAGYASHCGSSMWRASISACASANAMKSPMPPHTLKLTHVSSG